LGCYGSDFYETPDKFITRFENGKDIEEPIYSQANGQPFIGGKGKLSDTGTRVPLIANRPGTTPAGGVCDDLVDFSDFMPTFAELASGELPKERVIDGTSFVPQLKGQKGDPRKWAYCQWSDEAWVRTGRYKLYRDGCLFDIDNDRLEKSPIRVDCDTQETSRARKELLPVFSKLKN